MCEFPRWFSAFLGKRSPEKSGIAVPGSVTPQPGVLSQGLPCPSPQEVALREAVVWLRPDCFYQKLRVRLGDKCSSVPFVLHLLPRVYLEFRIKVLWLRQCAGTCT